MHNVTIYQIRNKELKAGGKPGRKRGRKPGRKPASTTATATANATATAPKVSIEALVGLVDFSKKFGGLDGLMETIKIIKSLKA